MRPNTPRLVCISSESNDRLVRRLPGGVGYPLTSWPAAMSQGNNQPVRRFVPFLLGVAVASMAGCGQPGSSGHLSTATTATTFHFHETVAVQGEYGGREDFCAAAPLTGHILYDGTTGSAVLTLSVGGLPRNTLVGVNWSNDHIRGYLIATFETGSKGRAGQSTLHFFRPGEVKGVELILTGSGIQAPVLGRLEPC